MIKSADTMFATNERPSVRRGRARAAPEGVARCDKGMYSGNSEAANGFEFPRRLMDFFGGNA